MKRRASRWPDRKGALVGVFDSLKRLMTPVSHRLAVSEWGPGIRSMVLGLQADELYRTQPHLRTVVEFLARNVAHLGVHAFQRTDDDGRERMRDDPLPLLLARPNAEMTRYDLFNALVSDLGLYDEAFWVVGKVSDKASRSGYEIRPMPPSWCVGKTSGGAFAVSEFIFHAPGGTERVHIPASNVIHFHGWNPGRPKHGASPVETLKQVLAEQVEAWAYRAQVWKRGGRASQVITRPAGKDWSAAARERFLTDWRARWTGDGANAGGTPILEDGMTIANLGFSARESEWSEVSKVALATVAAVYHVSPAMVGVIETATFASMKEHRKMLYSETLGPLIAMIEDRLNTFLVPLVTDAPGAYVEFNIAEKLQGDFEERAAIMSTAVGGPWMTRNEARKMENLPPIEGGDELIVPLNVISGGQASPQDGGTGGSPYGQLAAPFTVLALPPGKSGRTGRKGDAVRVKATATDEDAAKLERVLAKHFERQGVEVMAELGSKAPEWWDAARWDRELAADLLDLSLDMTTAAARDMLREAGVDPAKYSTARTRKFLEAVAESRASQINAATFDQVQAILDGDGPEGVESPQHVFDLGVVQRAAVIGVTLATTYAAFATVEAGKQTSAGSKTWLVMSGNPRPEHAAMSGETVGIDDVFSNGAKWPGDPVLGADGVAGCSCEVEVIYGG